MLLVRDDVPSSNVAVAEVVEKNKVMFAAAPHGGLARMWFHFQIFNNGQDPLPKTMSLILKHIQSMLGAGSGNFCPVIRYDDGKWERLPPGKIITRPDGHQTLEWQVKTPLPGKSLETAFCYPYGLNEFNTMLEDTGTYWKCDEIGVTGKGRSLFRLANSYGAESNCLPGVYLLARQHAGETSGAWVLDGALRSLAEMKVEFPVWCVPFVDMDGVIDGNYGKDSFPQDMNRSWGPHQPMRHEIMTVIRDLQIWKSRIIPEQSFIFDFHSPGANETGLYSFLFKEIPETAPFCKQLQDIGKALSPYSNENFVLRANYKPFSAWGNFQNLSEFAYHNLKVSAASFETSYYKAADKILTIDNYQEIGDIFARQIAKLVK